MADHEMTTRIQLLEAEVKDLLHRRTSLDVNVMHEERLTLGDRMADALASGAGSWRFIGSFMLVLVVWISLNLAGVVHHWDPYPFILLNLLLSCVAAIQAPVIMMSQNRLESRDRLRAENDYDVNVKAELLLEHLTEEVETLKRGLATLGAHFEEGRGPEPPPGR